MRRRPKDTTSLEALALIPHITLKIRKKRLRFSVPGELRILRKDDTDIHQAERYAFWRKMLERQAHLVRRVERLYKQELDTMVVQIPQKLRDNKQPASEFQVRAWARIQPSVRKLAERLERVQRDEGLCKLMCDAFEHRRSTLMKLKSRNTGES